VSDDLAVRDAVKRAIDVVGAAAGLVVTAPLLAVLAVAVRLRLGSPVLFRQERLGRGERPFHVVKLRTMTDERGPDGELLPDADRLTPFGRRLRASSLDELPELLNVLRGEMSLVGPRPLPAAYRDRYTPTERRRHEVRPGITGWAQVNGRNAVGWDERLALDVWYVDHHTTWLDLRILARTVGAVLARSGISAQGEATMGVRRPHLAEQATQSAATPGQPADGPVDSPVDGGDTSTAEGPSR
jgi:sugar transferase EpsL